MEKYFLVNKIFDDDKLVPTEMALASGFFELGRFQQVGVAEVSVVTRRLALNSFTIKQKGLVSECIRHFKISAAL